MVASIRDVKSATGTGGFSVPRPTVQSGDLLLCIHAADAGALSSMSIQGSGWTVAGQRGDDRITEDGGGTKVYIKKAGSSEPSSFSLSQASGASGVAVMLAIRGAGTAIVVRHDGDSAFPPFYDVTEAVCPSASISGVASGLDVRAAIGWDAGGSVSWQTPGGYTGHATPQTATVAMTVLSRTLVTSSAGPVTIKASRDMLAAHGITILVPSTAADERPPDPPSFPDWTPGRGTSLYRYTVHDLLTGEYRGDIYPQNVTFDRRVLEPGQFSATLPIPNRRVADQVAEIIPRYPEDLESGPGRITVRVWRAGELWGEYWITGAIISQSRRGGITIQLRGSTLEAYLHHVPVEQDLEYSGDEIACARSLLSHMMGLSGANIGLTLLGGESGQTRDLVVKADDNTTYGDALRAYAQSYPGFEYTIDPVVTHTGFQRRWRWGAPTLPFTRDHVFVQSPHGGDILDWSEEIDALRGATRVQVRGGTPEVEDAEQGSTPVLSDWVSATSHLAAGWPRYGRVVDHPGESTRKSTLNGYAQRWISALPGAVRVYSVTVALGARPTISPSSLGDWARRVMVNEWYPRLGGGAGWDSAQRLIGIGITPVARGSGREEAQLILEEERV